MTRNAAWLVSAALGTVGLLLVCLIFWAWRRGGLELLQLKMSFC